MKMDYRNVKNEYALIPNGWQSVVVEDVQIDATKNNHEVWKLTLSITSDNDYYNRKIWDNIIFKDTLQSRNKEIFRALGYDVDNQEIDVEPNDLLGKKVDVLLFQEKYEKDGKEKTINKVEFFDGYRPTGSDGGDDIPF